MLLYVLDMIGVFAFAVYGSQRALQARMDVLGLFVCAALTALGGGTVRAVVLQQMPGYFSDYTYIAVAAVGVAFAIVVHRGFDRLEPQLQVLDALGMATFALSGASKAADLGLGLGPMMLCALLTAAGGGVLCDLLTGRRPQLFYGEVYAVPACLMALLAWWLRPSLDDPIVCLLLVAGVFGVRMLGVLLRWRVWRPHAAAARGADPDNAVPLPEVAPPLPAQRTVQAWSPWTNDETVVLPPDWRSGHEVTRVPGRNTTGPETARYRRFRW